MVGQLNLHLQKDELDFIPFTKTIYSEWAIALNRGANAVKLSEFTLG
jgi:hypothetical protein